MNKDSIPFTVYDFLGYFIPGCIMLLFLIFYFKDTSIVVEIMNYKNENSFFSYIIFVISSYISGHVLNYLSSITIELFSILTLGYPSDYILYQVDSMCWLKKNVDQKNGNIFSTIILFIIISPIILTHFIIKILFGSSSLLGKKLDSFTQNVFTGEIKVFLNKFTGITKNKLNEKEYRKGYFNLMYHYVIETSPLHATRIHNFLNLFGFARTLCFMILIIFWIIVLNGLGGEFSLQVTLLLLFLFFLISVFYLAFNKFYRKYTLEVLYGFHVLFKKTALEA